MAKYVQNPGGHVHSLTDEAYEALLEGDGDTANRYLPHGYKDITEAQARKAHPQLFGEPDPQVEAARVQLGRTVDTVQITTSGPTQEEIDAKIADAVAAALAAQQQPEQPQK